MATSGMAPPPLPRFVSAGTTADQMVSRADDDVLDVDLNDSHNIFSNLLGGDTDFDLLAEFLLDDDGAVPISRSRAPSAVVSATDPVSTTVSVGASSASDGDNDDFNPVTVASSDIIHADPLADAAAAAFTSGNSNANAAVNILSKNLQDIQSLFPQPARMTSNTSVEEAVHAKAKNKRKHADNTTQLATVPAIPIIPISNNSVLSDMNLASNVPRLQQRKKSQAQIDRRRERNRILARRTRLRKKFFFESLQKDVTDLQRENTMLKNIVRTKISPPTKVSQILTECKAKNEIPNIVYENVLGSAAMDKQDISLVESLQNSQRCFIITDPSLQDNPIVYASPEFMTLTSYSREDVLGRNCRLLQGSDTCPKKIEILKKSVNAGDDVGVCLVNYTANGTPFWNQIFIAALRDAHNNIVNFVGVLSEVAGPSPDDPEYGKMLPSTEFKQSPEIDVDSMVQLAVEAADAVTNRSQAHA